jgi:hypothetical protein
MFYRKNVGRKERWGRLFGGASVTACSLALIGLTPLGIGLAATGAFAGLTGVLGYCPACAMAGRKPAGEQK